MGVRTLMGLWSCFFDAPEEWIPLQDQGFRRVMGTILAKPDDSCTDFLEHPLSNLILTPSYLTGIIVLHENSL